MLHDLIGAIPEVERSAHVALVTRLFGDTAQEKREVPTGYVFRFRPETFDQVAQFVSRERRCCPFHAFEITLTPHGSARIPTRTTSASRDAGAPLAAAGP